VFVFYLQDEKEQYLFFEESDFNNITLANTGLSKEGGVEFKVSLKFGPEKFQEQNRTHPGTADPPSGQLCPGADAYRAAGYRLGPHRQGGRGKRVYPG